MSFDERLTWLLIGVVIGYILGRLRDIGRREEEILSKVEEVDEHVKKQRRVRDEGGFMRYPVFADVMVLFLVAFTLYASFVSQKSANESEKNTDDLAMVVQKLDETQNVLRAVTSCNTVFQQRTIRALNERTQYTGAQAQSNIELQKAQAAFLQIALIIPPVTKSELRAALERYYGNLASFVEISAKNRQALKYKYPTNEELSTCITESIDVAQKQNQEKANE